MLKQSCLASLRLVRQHSCDNDDDEFCGDDAASSTRYRAEIGLQEFVHLLNAALQAVKQNSALF